MSVVTKEQILNDKVKDLLQNNFAKNTMVLEQIESENNDMEDFILPLGPKSPVVFQANGSINAEFDNQSFHLHENALGQLSDKYNIPRAYLRYLLTNEWGRKLLENILKEHTGNVKQTRMLFRTVNGEIRAVLSDKYRRLNSAEIYRKFIGESAKAEAYIYEAAYMPTKSYISTIIPQVVSIETTNNGMVHSVFGARLSNSDFGDGALALRAFQMNVICLNGMVGETMLKQIHLGKALPDNINFSDRTYRLDTETTSSMIEDIMREVLSVERIKTSMQNIQEASQKIIDIPTELIKLPKIGMLKEEVTNVEAKLLINNYNDGLYGAPTMWKLSQAITAVANEVSTSRKMELSELSGKLIKL